MNRPLWKVSVRTTPEAEEAVAEVLGRIFSEPVSSYTDLESSSTEVMVYLLSRPVQFEQKHQQLRAGLRQLQTCGLRVGSGRITLAKIQPRDWAHAWKRHFKPIEVGRTLLIRPSWSRRQPRIGQKLLVLDPGLSFGTGQHPTTLFCLQQIVARRASPTRQSLLDIGTGSGILALAAAKLGYAPVHALDYDSGAIAIARANARQNRLADRVRFRRADIAKVPQASLARGYSLVCANLISTLLLEQKKRLLEFLAPNGFLILAGILKSEFPRVEAAYRALGLRLVASRAQREWRSGAFRRK